MKKLVLALFATAVFCSLYAKVYEWPQLPDAALPDTEVVTNVALRVNVERLDVFSLKLEIDGTGAASEVLVAVGHDADENGDLSFEETAFVFGCDCGERYLVNHQTGRVFTGLGDTVAVIDYAVHITNEAFFLIKIKHNTRIPPQRESVLACWVS